MYIVMEIQTNANGTIGTLINTYEDKLQAESKYHAVLTAAAVSALPVHACVVLTEKGEMQLNKAYEHNA